MFRQVRAEVIQLRELNHEAPAGVLWVEIAGMILGRLEFFAVVVGLFKVFGDGAAWLGDA